MGETHAYPNCTDFIPIITDLYFGCVSWRELLSAAVYLTEIVAPGYAHSSACLTMSQPGVKPLPFPGATVGKGARKSISVFVAWLEVKFGPGHTPTITNQLPTTSDYMAQSNARPPTPECVCNSRLAQTNSR
ncbi:hypothetical protein Bbelb_102340 [Branchiostoma belcheri]|nr:hypothetical protein Bbelb_102340 [Branchiostoma belcheri]